MASTAVQARIRVPGLCTTDPGELRDHILEAVGDHLRFGEGHKFDTDSFIVSRVEEVSVPQGACPSCTTHGGYRVNCRGDIGSDSRSFASDSETYTCNNCGARRTRDEQIEQNLPVINVQEAS